MKKATIDYKDGAPVGMRELKEFKDENSYKAFLGLCAVNKEKADKAEALATALEEEERQKAVNRLNRRVAWIALLWTEMELDHGTLALTDEEYSAFKDNFNLGDIKSLEDMPSPFVAVYEMLKEEL